MKHQTYLKIIICALAAGLLSGCSDPESATERAYAAIETGDYATAVSIADAAISGGGADKSIYRAKGIALLGEGDPEASRDAFESALRCSNGLVEQTDMDISYYLAVDEYKMGDIERAKQTMDAVLALRPKDDGAYFLRGKIELALNEKEAAIADFDSSIELAPTDYDRYVGIYEELHSKGFETEANAYLEKAMSAGSKLSDYNKGVLEYYLGSYTDARTDLENARKSQVTENLILYLGRTYEALGDDTYAMTIYEDFIRENSQAGRIYEQLSTCKIKNGDYEGALETIEAGLSLGNGDGAKGLMFNRAVAYEMLYDFDKAKEYMAQYVELYPDDEVAQRENLFLGSR